ncbi:MAG: preprotein translocase subunit SecE [Denitrovibrio sp.]|nr:MAG: preprotein translocase subunit SecE [Denitrovibrio sp.]
MGKWSEFYKEVKEELKKVVWPSKESTIGTTGIVIAICIVISIFMGVVDFGLAKITQFIY